MLETDRLILRKFKESDLEDFLEYTSNKENCEMVGFENYSNLLEAKKGLLMKIRRNESFAIVLKENKKVIGEIEVLDYYPLRNSPIKHENGTKELAFILSEKYWSKGFMAEALNEVTHYLFRKMNVPQIVISYLDKNKRSERVIEKIGFPKSQKSNNLRIWIDGSDSEIMQSSMTCEEYNKKSKRREYEKN